MIYSDILKNIKTLSRVEEISFEIDRLLDSIFKTKKKSFEESLKSISIKTAYEIKTALHENKISLDNHKTIGEFLIELKSQIHNFKVIKITLAFSPTEAIIDSIFSWVLKNLGFGIILDIAENQSIIGGAIITFNGKYKDFSIRKRLDYVFEAKKEELTEFLSINRKNQFLSET